MSTSLLYHGFGIAGVKYSSTNFDKGQITFNSEMTKNQVKCPKCSCYSGIFRGKKMRHFHTGKLHEDLI